MAGHNAYWAQARPPANPADPKPLLNARIDDGKVQARAYGRWVSMLRGRTLPSIEDLEPFGVAGPCDVLIDLTRGAADPELACIGGALIADCGTRGMKRVSQVREGSYLALLTAHHRQAAATREPIAFEGERAGAWGRPGEYRGILLPLSSDGQTVDFVHGTISWRERADDALAAKIEEEAARDKAPASNPSAAAIWPAPREDRDAGSSLSC